jgi:riboflavin kinase/FMN adenylyltransferase
MRIVRGLESYPPEPPPSAVALGAFDGIHVGHRAILGTAISIGRRRGLAALACTFDPHPLEVLQPAAAPAPITTLTERLHLMAETGVDATIVLEFTPALAAMEPEAFVKDVLLARLGAREIIVGYNHRFGHRARGDAGLLSRLAPGLGFTAHVVPPQVVDGVPVSSSEIRALLKAGNVEQAARFLGRPYTVLGRVVRGVGRGRTLGFPTANVEPDRPLLIPTGVYACRATVEGAAHAAVVNIGFRPTFAEQTLAVEAHLLDFAGDLYERPLALAFVRRLRGEQKFPGPEALQRQIAQDIALARESL